jgi:hypothetical protein
MNSFGFVHLLYCSMSLFSEVDSVFIYQYSVFGFVQVAISSYLYLTVSLFPLYMTGWCLSVLSLLDL